MGVLGPVLVALVMQLLALIGTGYWVHTWLVASAFDGWHGLLNAHPYYRPADPRDRGQPGLDRRLPRRGLDDAAQPRLRRHDGRASARLDAAGAHLAWWSRLRSRSWRSASNWGPAAVTAAKLEAAIKPTFNNLTLLQQHFLGRRVPKGAHLNDVAQCQRRSGSAKGQGDDWVCTMNMLIILDGPEPVLVHARGIRRQRAKPTAATRPTDRRAFIGAPTLDVSHGRSVVNPLFSFDGCFDPT